MEQYDYEIDHSLRLASDANSSAVTENDSSDASVQHIDNLKSSASSSTSKQTKTPTESTAVKGETEVPYPNLTINTRRRLIRKPLPQTPDKREKVDEEKSSTSKIMSSKLTSGNQHPIHTMDDKEIQQIRNVGITHSAIFSRNQAQNYHPITLEEARNKAKNFIAKEKAILEWWPDVNHSVKAEQSSSQSSSESFILNKRCRNHLERIVEFSIHSSTELDKVESTSIAKCITNAILICLSSLTEADALAALQQTSSVMWRVDALVRSNDQFSGAKGGLNTLLGVLGVRWPKLASWRGKETSEVASDGGSEAIGRPIFADKRSFSTSSSMTMGTEQRRRKRDVAMQLLNNAFWTAGVNASEEGGFQDIEQNAKSKADEKKRPIGAAPALLTKPVAPIVALTGEVSSTNELHKNAEEGGVEPKGDQKGEDGAQTNSSDSALSKQSVDRKSLLTDRLAMQLRNATKVQTENGIGTSSRVGSISVRNTMSRSVSNTSLFDHIHSSTSTSQSEAAKVKIAVCTVCVRFEDDWNKSTAKLLRSRRQSDTITTKDAQRRIDNSSSISGQSEKTIGQLISQRNTVQNSNVVIDWIKDDFEGEPLHLNPLSSDIEGREQDSMSEGVRTIGGTFAVYGVDEQLRIAVHDTFDIALYAAIAMMLETSFLCDFDLTPKDAESSNSPEKDSGKVKFSDVEEGGSDNDINEASNGNYSHLETSNERTTSVEPNQGHWPRNIWNILHMGGPTLSQSVEPKSNSPNKRSSIGFPRTRTTETSSPSRHKKGPSMSHYGRISKLLSSFTGNANRKLPDEFNFDGRLRSFSDARRSSLVDFSEEDNQSALITHSNDDHSTFLDGDAPKNLSAYHDDDDNSIQSQQQNAEEDLMKDLIARQTLSLLVVEGLDVSLPFARQNPGVIKDSRIGNTTKLNSDIAKGSTLTVQSDLASGSSRFSTHSRTTEASSRYNQKAPSPNRKKDGQQDILDNNRRDVLFYQRGGTCRDTTLGQAIEEMVAKTVVLHKEWLQTDKNSKQDNPIHTFKIAQYLHDRDKITVSASVIKLKEVDLSSGMVTNTVTEAPTPSISDVKEIANTLKTDKDLAQTALRLAEHIQSTVQNQSTGNTENVKENLSNESKKSKIEMWHADMRTGRQTVKKLMSDATYLLSYGTFLNDLMTSPFFIHESPMLHGTNEDDKELLDSSDDPKHDLVRLFKIDNVILKFHIQTISVYDLLIDGPVICSDVPKDFGDKYEKKDTITKSLVNETRTEIRDFFASVKDEVSRMEHIFVARELDINGNTMKPVAPPPSSRDSVRSIFSVQNGGIDEEQSDRNSIATSAISSYSGVAGEPLELLAKLMGSVRKSEFLLYELLKEADISSLNDIRRQFLDRAKSSKNRLIAWSQKHLSKDEAQKLGTLNFVEPFYFQKGNHAFPGSRFILRQDEPLSIIAYSLSSRDFNEEIEVNKSLQKKHFDVLNWRSSVAIGENKENNGSVFSSTTADTGTASVTSSRMTDELDPDEDAEFHVPEPLRVNMKRKKRTKDVGILSLRIRSSNHSISQGGGLDDNSSLSQSLMEDNNQDQKEQENDSQISITVNDESSTPTASKVIPSTRFDTVSSNNDNFHAHVSTISPRGLLGDLFTNGGRSERLLDHLEGLAPPSECGQEAASLLSSSVSSRSSGTEKEGGYQETPKMHNDSRMRLADQDDTKSETENADENKLNMPKKDQLVSKPRIPPQPINQPASPHIKHSILSGDLKISCISWFAEDFNKLRKTWKIEEDFINSLSRSKSWNNIGGKSKSGFLLTGDGKWIAKQLLNVWTVDEKEAFLEFAPAYLRYMMNSAVNDCPTLLVKIAGVYTLKIKDIKTGEVKLKLSVQILENVFAGDHGQSIRFDLKGIKDRRVSNTTLQKMQSNTTTTSTSTEKENEATTKGVEEEGADKGLVWWDGEWIDTMLPRAFVPEKHKVRFKRALRNDMAFLTASNVMDYSLLVGVNEPIRGSSSLSSARKSNRQPSSSTMMMMKDVSTKDLDGDHHTFRVRIVDFLGAWTLVKQLESSGKKAIKSQTPTIIPPQDYANRFSQAIESYFIGCPAAVEGE